MDDDGRRPGERAMTLGLHLKRAPHLFDGCDTPYPSAGGGALSDLSHMLTHSALSLQLGYVIEF